MGSGPHEIVIIGGGPAGSAAAFHLARSGFAATVVESKSFPRVKVCGEYISPAATHLLSSILTKDQLAQAGAREVSEFVIEVGQRRRTWPTPAPGLALSRSTLDQLLLDQARAAGANILQPASVRSVSYSDAAAHVHLA